MSICTYTENYQFPCNVVSSFFYSTVNTEYSLCSEAELETIDTPLTLIFYQLLL